VHQLVTARARRCRPRAHQVWVPSSPVPLCPAERSHWFPSGPAQPLARLRPGGSQPGRRHARRWVTGSSPRGLPRSWSFGDHRSPAGRSPTAATDPRPARRCRPARTVGRAGAQLESPNQRYGPDSLALPARPRRQLNGRSAGLTPIVAPRA
jgi:hypothetical protein